MRIIVQLDGIHCDEDVPPKSWYLTRTQNSVAYTVRIDADSKTRCSVCKPHQEQKTEPFGRHETSQLFEVDAHKVQGFIECCLGRHNDRINVSVSVGIADAAFGV